MRWCSDGCRLLRERSASIGPPSGFGDTAWRAWHVQYKCNLRVWGFVVLSPDVKRLSFIHYTIYLIYRKHDSYIHDTDRPRVSGNAGWDPHTIRIFWCW